MRKMHGEGGAAAVEFAIVASVLFLVLFGTVQFGIAFNRMQGVQAGAREGARIGSLPDTTVSEILTRVRDSVSIVDPAALPQGCGALSTDQGCIDITPSGSAAFQPCNLRSGQVVTVLVRYRTEISIPLWRAEGVTLEGKGEFRCE